MTTALAKRPDTALDPYAPTSHEQARDQAEIVAASHLYGLHEPAQAYVVLMTGHDLGLSPSQALRGVHVIEGKPSPSADTLHAIVLNSPLCEYFKHIETTDDHSTWETKRVGYEPERGTYTIEEARAAGLVKPKGNWEKHPRRMLRARAKAFLCRDVYPDITLGLYTPDELLESAPTRATVERVDLPVELQAESVNDPDPWQSRMARAADAGDWSGAKQIARDAQAAGESGALDAYSEMRLRGSGR